jgi:TPR repeat protein
MRLLDLAADQGNIEALFFKSELYVDEQNFVEADKYLLRAAECGHDRTQFEFGKYNLKNKNRDEAIRWFDAAASKDHDEAQLNLGLLLMQGSSDEQLSGIKWIKIAAQNENQEAIEWLKTAAQSGNQEAIEWLKTAAEDGNQDVFEWIQANLHP